MEVIWFVLAGCLAGTSAGLFGVGGGLVIVPVLVWVFGTMGMNNEVISHVALGTSLATIIITSISSMTAHHKAGNVRFDILKNMAIGLMIGSLLGAFVAKLLKSDTLQVIIGAGATLMAIKMLFFPNQENLDKSLPSAGVQIGVGGGIGLMAAIFGIGGGSLTVPFLNHCGLPMKKAVGTSAACGLPIAVAGAAGFLLFGQGVETGVSGVVGFVHVWAFICISAASAVFAKVGARLAQILPAKRLKQGFGGLLMVVGLNLIRSGLW